MEILVGLLMVMLAIGYAVVMAVAISRRKPWAIEIARALAALEPRWIELDQIHRVSDRESVRRRDEQAKTPDRTDRLAA